MEIAEGRKGDRGILVIFTNTLTPRYILGDRMASVIWRLRYAYIGPRFLYCFEGALMSQPDIYW